MIKLTEYGECGEKNKLILWNVSSNHKMPKSLTWSNIIAFERWTEIITSFFLNYNLKILHWKKTDKLQLSLSISLLNVNWEGLEHLIALLADNSSIHEGWLEG